MYRLRYRLKRLSEGAEPGFRNALEERGGVEVVEARRRPLCERSVVGMFDLEPESTLPIESRLDLAYDDVANAFRCAEALPLEDYDISACMFQSYVSDL